MKEPIRIHIRYRVQEIANRQRILIRFSHNRGLSNTKSHICVHIRCFLCKKNHFMQYCQRLIDLNIKKRIELDPKKKGLCANCFQYNHNIVPPD